MGQVKTKFNYSFDSEATAAAIKGYDPPRRRPLAWMPADLATLREYGFEPSQATLDAVAYAVAKESEYQETYAAQMGAVQGARLDWIRDREIWELDQARTKEPGDWEPYPIPEPDFELSGRAVQAYDQAAQEAFHDVRATVGDDFFEALGDFFAEKVNFEPDPAASLADHQEKHALARTLIPIIVRVNTRMAKALGAVPEEQKRLRRAQNELGDSDLVNWPVLRDQFRGIIAPGIELADLKLRDTAGNEIVEDESEVAIAL